MPYWPTKERNQHPLSTSTRGVFWRRLGWENSLLSGYLTLWKIHSPHKWMERANWRHWVFEPQVLKMGSVRRGQHMAQHSTQPQSSTIPMISFKASNRLLPSARKIEPWHDWTKHATFLPTNSLIIPFHDVVFRSFRKLSLRPLHRKSLEAFLKPTALCHLRSFNSAGINKRSGFLFVQ